MPIDWSLGEQPIPSPDVDATSYAGTDQFDTPVFDDTDPSEIDVLEEPLVDVPIWSDVQKSSKYYTRYEVCVRHHGKSGLLCQPVAAGLDEDVPHEFVRVHKPRLRMTICWLAERLGAKPIMPHKDLGHPNCVLMEWEIIPENPYPQTDGSYLYRCRGTYVYDLQTSTVDDVDYLFVGTTNAVVATTVENALGPQQFDRSILAGIIFTATPTQVDY